MGELILFVKDGCSGCQEVEEWLMVNPLEGLKVIRVSDQDVEALAEADFFDIVEYPSLVKDGMTFTGEQIREELRKLWEHRRR